MCIAFEYIKCSWYHGTMVTFMKQEKNVTGIIAYLEASGPLAHREDFTTLLTLADSKERQMALDEASFIAKFLIRTMGIMRRIGRDGTGYEQLAGEFTANIKRVRHLLRSLVEKSSDATRLRFTTLFLDVTPSSLDNLLSLCDDLMRYKNWRLDDERGDRAHS